MGGGGEKSPNACDGAEDGKRCRRVCSRTQLCRRDTRQFLSVSLPPALGDKQQQPADSKSTAGAVEPGDGRSSSDGRRASVESRAGVSRGGICSGEECCSLLWHGVRVVPAFLVLSANDYATLVDSRCRLCEGSSQPDAHRLSRARRAAFGQSGRRVSCLSRVGRVGEGDRPRSGGRGRQPATVFLLLLLLFARGAEAAAAAAAGRGKGQSL